MTHRSSRLPYVRAYRTRGGYSWRWALWAYDASAGRYRRVGTATTEEGYRVWLANETSETTLASRQAHLKRFGNGASTC